VTYDPPLLYDLDLPALQGWIREQGQPASRAGQIFRWLYQRFALAFAEMTDLPRELRGRLEESFTLPGAAPLAEQRGEETLKLLLQLPDGAEVECVSIAMEGLPTFCLSTQVGCAMRCAFCASTLQGCARNLTAGEILAQAALLGARSGRPGNVVFMGMGEPCSIWITSCSPWPASPTRRLSAFPRAKSPSPPSALSRKSASWGSSTWASTWRSRSTPPVRTSAAS